MATAAASRPSGPVLSIPTYGCASPNRVKLAPAVRACSPGKAVSVTSPPAARSRPSCMCSPTNHPGSFRCSKHKERNKQEATACHGHGKAASQGSGASKLGTKRTSSVLVRLGGAVDSGTWARRALSPSPHRRRAAGGFRPGPAASPPSPSPVTAPGTTAAEQTSQPTRRQAIAARY